MGFRIVEDDSGLYIISAKWLTCNSTACYYPPVKEGTRLWLNTVVNETPPQSDWDIRENIHLFGDELDTYERARHKLNRLSEGKKFLTTDDEDRSRLRSRESTNKRDLTSPLCSPVNKKSKRNIPSPPKLYLPILHNPDDRYITNFESCQGQISNSQESSLNSALLSSYSLDKASNSILQLAVKIDELATEQVRLDAALVRIETKVDKVLQAVVPYTSSHSSKQGAALPEYFPMLPLSDKEETDKLLHVIENSENHVHLANYMAQAGGTNLKTTVDGCMRKLILPKFAYKTFNWSGIYARNGLGGPPDSPKLPLKNSNLLLAIFVAVRKNPKVLNATDSDISQEVRTWIISARDKDGGRVARQSSQNAIS